MSAWVRCSSARCKILEVLGLLASIQRYNCLKAAQLDVAVCYFKIEDYFYPTSPNSGTAATVKNRKFDSLFFTVEFFGLRIFSLGEVLRANFC